MHVCVCVCMCVDVCVCIVCACVCVHVCVCACICMNGQDGEDINKINTIYSNGSIIPPGFKFT